MRWIGQQIYDLVSRFRNDVHIEGQVFIGKRVGNAVNSVSDFSIYQYENDSNPSFSLGAVDTSRLEIQTVYHSGARTIDYVNFKTYTPSTGSDDGEMKFSIDETAIFSIQDAGINLEASKNLSIGGNGILRDSSGTTLLTNIDGGSGNTLYDLVIDSNRVSDDTDAEDFTSLHVDLDRTVATSGTHAHNDRGIDLDVTSTSLGTSSLYGMDIDVVGATNGTSTAYGIDLNVSGADTNIGMQVLCEGEQLRLSHNAADYATFTVADTGDLTIATVGDGARDSDLILDADGQIKLEPVDGSSILLDGTITVDAGVVTGVTSLTLDSVGISAVQTASESFADNDTSIMTSAAIDDAILKGGSTTTIKILPHQFMSNEDGGVNKSEQYDDTGTIGVRASSADAELYAFVEIPIGKTATSVVIYGNDTNNVVEVFEADINASGLADKTPGGGCVVGSACDITDVAADATNYLAIRVTVTATSDIIYGGAVTVSG